MSIRTFWTILLKVMGIWLILASLSVVPSFFSIGAFIGDNDSDNLSVILLGVGIMVLTLVIYLIVLKLLVFNPGWLIDKLNLDKGFGEDTIDLNMNLNTILRIATIVLGGVTFIGSFPLLCKAVFQYFQQKHNFVEAPDTGWLILYLGKSLIGYLLLTNSRWVVAYLDKKRSEGE